MLKRTEIGLWEFQDKMINEFLIDVLINFGIISILGKQIVIPDIFKEFCDCLKAKKLPFY